MQNGVENESKSIIFNYFASLFDSFVDFLHPRGRALISDSGNAFQTPFATLGRGRQKLSQDVMLLQRLAFSCRAPLSSHGHMMSGELPASRDIGESQATPYVRELQTRSHSDLPARDASKDQNKHVEIRAPKPSSTSSEQEQTYTNSQPLVEDTPAQDLLAAGGGGGKFG